MMLAERTQVCAPMTGFKLDGKVIMPYTGLGFQEVE